MRYFGLRGVTIETAGQSGTSASSEGNLIGVIDAVSFRDAVLTQRQKVLDRTDSDGAPEPGTGSEAVLREIRDILARIEAQGRPG